MPAPSVSVCVTSYQSAGTLRACLEAVLAQTFPPREVIVADDGSTDRTLDVARSFGDAVRISTSTHNQGGPAWGRNRALQAATGDFVAFCDADDLWLPHKLETQMVAASHGAQAICSAATRRLLDGTTSTYPVGRRVGDHQLGFRDLMRINHVVASSAVVLRSRLVDVGGFPAHPSAIGCEDYACWMKVATHVPWYLIDEPLVIYADGAPSLRTTSRATSVSIRREVSRALLEPPRRARRARRVRRAPSLRGVRFALLHLAWAVVRWARRQAGRALRARPSWRAGRGSRAGRGLRAGRGPRAGRRPR